MRKVYDLSKLEWQITGLIPYQWAFFNCKSFSEVPAAEVSLLKTSVPGSVQKALLDAGIIEDWNTGMNARKCEWVENRHWVYEALLPAELVNELSGEGLRTMLVCEGLDYSGWVLINGREVGEFKGTFIPHEFNFTPHLASGGEVRLQVIFDIPPRWLGQFGYTSKMTSWKPRFNYTWDWTSRLVQIGIWDRIYLTVADTDSIVDFCLTTGLDTLSAGFRNAGTLKAEIKTAGIRGCEDRLIRLSLFQACDPDHRIIYTEILPCSQAVFDWQKLDVEPWWPSGIGEQPLYTVRAELLKADGEVLDFDERSVGFRDIRWDHCEGAPADADPWICVVNGTPVFLQGVNWTPIRPNFADVTENDVELRLRTYKELGCNLLRVWGGAYLEREDFYSLCDSLGLMVWQEFPLSSSGMENWPPEDPKAIEELCAIADSYINRRRHHPCLMLWSGGNELQGGPDGSKTGTGKPVDLSHPLMKRFSELVAIKDQGRRFIPTSACGPAFTADERDFGKGIHWDVHGPWSIGGSLEDWKRYWDNDDALFRSETGCPGASPAEIIEEYRDDLPVMPCSLENPLWRRTSWWVEWDVFVRENSCEPANLQEYVEWSQKRQAEALRIAADASKRRFPRIGGFIIWMGHDSFPCTANTSILDFNGNPKPAALSVGEVFRQR